MQLIRDGLIKTMMKILECFLFLMKLTGERLNVYLTTLTVVTEVLVLGKGKVQIYHRKLDYDVVMKLFKDAALRQSGIKK